VTATPSELPPGSLADFLERMRVQLGVLVALADRLTVAGDDRGALDALGREIRQIRGFGGSHRFTEAARLAAGMEATVNDWIARPGDRDVDRGSIAHWFVGRLAEMLGLEVAPAVARAAHLAPAPPPLERTAPEVIFVEDDPSLAELLEYGLNAHGYRFTAYRNGREALQALLALDVQGTHPLLLLAVDLPGLDGYSMFDALERERPGTYRVVFTTARGTEEEQLRGLEAGALDYLVKPISLRVALEKIKRWVAR
jgi:CheY-like chemotaxis protein